MQRLLYIINKNYSVANVLLILSSSSSSSSSISLSNTKVTVLLLSEVLDTKACTTCSQGAPIANKNIQYMTKHKIMKINTCGIKD